MEIVLSGRTALVTGGSKGLGKAIARRMAQSGANVAILARDPEVLKSAAQEIAAETGRDVRGYACDVSKSAELDRVYQQVHKDFSVIDILVNNAGSSARSPFLGLTLDVLQADMDLKLAAALRLAQLTVPAMQTQRWGRILNILNIGAKAPRGASAPTSVSRAAGMAMTKVMANEFAEYNILVNALLVGRINSDQWVRRHARDCPEVPYAEYLRKLGSDIPLGRMGEAEEFAQVACFLASDMGSYVTGTAINVDGGVSPVV